ncbi:hypothetical protein ACFQO1_01275 [Jejudonia soesokkakensis]|uniref:Adhesin domain-containing protein n=1 Tax=Jejudonia soesokkakensis TaxID=1323432 RepID=A0ABW2MN30_9FLAO
MLKTLVLLFFVFIISESAAQKILQKEIDAQQITQLSIDGTSIFKIEIFSEERNTIEIISNIEGEYSESMMIATKIIKNALSISSAFSPYFKKDNDKLAAHKIESVSLVIKVPHQMVVGVISDIANLTIDGLYNFVDVSLENGKCTLTNFIGNATLVTNEGDILVKASAVDVSGTLFSKLGTEINELPDGNRFLIEAYSLRGDIVLQQTEK